MKNQKPKKAKFYDTKLIKLTDVIDDTIDMEGNIVHLHGGHTTTKCSAYEDYIEISIEGSVSSCKFKLGICDIVAYYGYDGCWFINLDNDEYMMLWKSKK